MQIRFWQNDLKHGPMPVTLAEMYTLFARAATTLGRSWTGIISTAWAQKTLIRIQSGGAGSRSAGISSMEGRRDGRVREVRLPSPAPSPLSMSKVL